MGGWEPMTPRTAYPARERNADPREGKVQATQFVAEGGQAAALGHGVIEVVSAPGNTSDGRDGATYEAAVVDQLVKAGYETSSEQEEQGQVAELVVTRDVVRPEEPPRKPVSGEATVGVSNHGSVAGLAVAVDLRKPLKALVATRLERPSNKAHSS